MNTSRLLQIASGLTVLHAVGHTIGGVFGSATPGPMEDALTVMKTNQFVAMGVTRTYWDFHQGLNIFGTISMTLEAVVLWQLSTLAKTSAVAIKPILWTFAIIFLLSAPITFTYFFAAPAIFEVAIAAVIAIAITKAK